MECKYKFNFVEFSTNPELMGSPVEPVCACCKSRDGVFVPLSSCLHSSVICNIFMIEMKLTDQHICIYCHAFLKKVEAFKKNLELDIHLNNAMVPDVKPEKLYNLSFSKISHISLDINITDVSTSQQIEAGNSNDLKTENISDNEGSSDTCDQEEFDELTVKDDIEITDDFTDNLNLKSNINICDTSTSKTVNNPTIKQLKIKTNLKNNAGNIKVTEKTIPNKEIKYPPTKIYEGIYQICLTMEELMKEREEARQKESYIKLPYKCEMCIVGFDHEVNLFNHNNMRHSPKPDGYTCDLCKTVLKNFRSYESHWKRHLQRYRCEPCGRTNCTLYNILEHHNREHGTIGHQYDCPNCNFTSRSWRQIRYHRNTHKDRLPCTKCHLKFVNNDALKRHLLVTHSDTKRSFPCEHCDKVYRLKGTLRQHVARQHAGRGARCGLCDKTFASEATLSAHIKLSSAHVSKEQWKFVCDYCGEKFLQKTRIREHILFEHLKSQEHKCKLCNKVLRNKRHLKRHTACVHEKQRPPRDKICQYCGKAFNNSKILRCHIRTHTGERPLKCQHCPADFAHNAALYTHNKLVHGVKKKKDQ